MIHEPVALEADPKARRHRCEAQLGLRNLVTQPSDECVEVETALAIESPFELGHEEVVLCQEPASNYRAILAVHSTVLGPALGGTRMRAYDSAADALTDALHLSRAMTYKNAAAGLALGGGKAVILEPAAPYDREELFLAHGRAVDRLGGRFITGVDVGTSPGDFEIAGRATQWVAGFEGRGGDPAIWTARGVVAGIKACAQYRWGSPALNGRVVALQGCGNVGAAVARTLAEAGAQLVLCDADPDRVQQVAEEIGARVVEPGQIHELEADIFAPCALGAILNDQTIPILAVQVVAGAANNQLAQDRHAAALAERGILYAPDFVMNAGGVISGSVPVLNQPHDAMVRQVDGIADTLLEVFAEADHEGITTVQAAERRAERALARGRVPGAHSS